MPRERGWIFLGLAVSLAAATLLALSTLHAALTAEGLDASAVRTLQLQRQAARALAAHAQLNLVYEERDIAAMAGLVLWLDGADGTTLFQDVGATLPAGLALPVALWRDKSGGARHLLQVAPLLQPTRSDAGSGRTAVQFNGSTLLQSLPAAVSYQGGVSSFIVWRADAVGQAQVLLATIALGVAADWRLDGLGQLLWRAGAPAAGDAAQPVFGATWTLSSGVSNAAGASHWKDGDAPAGNAAPFASADVLAAFSAGSDGLQGFGGAIAEVLQFARPLTALERQRVEGYLARKWDITLPEGHRYRDRFPLPCPVDPAAAAAQLYDGYDATGLESRDVELGTCASQVGLLPWQTLGLARRDAFDAWGSPFTYAVTPSAAQAQGAQRTPFCGQAPATLDYAADTQRLSVSADGSDTVPDAAASVPVALVISHGPDRVGAYGPQRARAALPAASADASSTQSSNYDDAGSAEARRLFAGAAVSLQRDASHFDDLVWSATAGALLRLAPAGARCP